MHIFYKGCKRKLSFLKANIFTFSAFSNLNLTCACTEKHLQFDLVSQAINSLFEVVFAGKYGVVEKSNASVINQLCCGWCTFRNHGT